MSRNTLLSSSSSNLTLSKLVPGTADVFTPKKKIPGIFQRNRHLHWWKFCDYIKWWNLPAVKGCYKVSFEIVATKLLTIIQAVKECITVFRQSNTSPTILHHGHSHQCFLLVKLTISHFQKVINFLVLSVQDILCTKD